MNITGRAFILDIDTIASATLTLNWNSISNQSQTINFRGRKEKEFVYRISEELISGVYVIIFMII